MLVRNNINFFVLHANLCTDETPFFSHVNCQKVLGFCLVTAMELSQQVSNISVFVESPCRTRVSKVSRVRSVILLEFTLSVETIKDA